MTDDSHDYREGIAVAGKLFSARYTTGVPDPVSADAYDIRFLDASKCRLEREPDGARIRMHVGDEVCWIDVRIARALPISNPGEYIAVRDVADAEIGVFRSLGGMDQSSRDLVLDALDRDWLLPAVTRVVSVKEQSGLVLWDIDTDHGRRKFAVRNIRDNSVAITGKRVLVTDVDGNRYDFRDIYALGRQAGEILQKVL